MTEILSNIEHLWLNVHTKFSDRRLARIDLWKGLTVMSNEMKYLYSSTIFNQPGGVFIVIMLHGMVQLKKEDIVWLMSLDCELVTGVWNSSSCAWMFALYVRNNSSISSKSYTNDLRQKLYMI
jgi:hypothetical protein